MKTGKGCYQYPSPYDVPSYFKLDNKNTFYKLNLKFKYIVDEKYYYTFSRAGIVFKISKTNRILDIYSHSLELKFITSILKHCKDTNFTIISYLLEDFKHELDLI